MALPDMKTGDVEYLVNVALSGDHLSHAIIHTIDQNFRRKEREQYYDFYKFLIDTALTRFPSKTAMDGSGAANRRFKSL